jgi:hypothetical protein
MSLDSIIDVQISALTTSVARRGFGIPLIVAYFPTTIFPERVRTYTSLTAMTDDGFPETHPAYLMATALKAQNPSVRTWKVGRRALPMTQELRITPTMTTEGEIVSLTVEGTEVTYTIPAAATVASVLDGVNSALNAIVGVTHSDDTTHGTLYANRKKSVRVTVTTADDEVAFTVTINGTTYSYTSDTSATVTEIRDGLEALLTASDEPITVADVSTNAMDITADDEIGFEIYVGAGGTGVLTLSASVSAYSLLHVSGIDGFDFQDRTANPGIATDLSAIEAEDGDFYGLLIDSNSEAEIAAAAAWAEARTVIFGASSMDSIVLDSGTTTDIFSDLETAGYNRAYGIYTVNTGQYSAARWMGKMLPQDPGSATWAFQKLSGNDAAVLTGGEQTALDGKKANYYHSVAGVSITRNGWASSGLYIDIQWGVDWLKDNIQTRLFQLLVDRPKLPFTQSTADLIRAELLAALLEAQRNGIVAPDTEDQPWVVTVPPPGDVSALDRAARIWSDCEFSAYLAGAAHEIQIQGTLTA